jgi:HAD superfamily phosphatase (TIGR01668 family)
MLAPLFKKYFKPDKKFKYVSEISLIDLKNEGIRGIILDLDDTLVPSDKKVAKQFINDWLFKAKEDFSLFVVSNNRKPNYVKLFCDEIGIPFIARALKPRGKFLEKAINQMNLDKKSVVIVGDRVTTDILAANLLGIKSILVSPLTEMPSLLQKTIYKIESIILQISDPKM